MNRAAIEMAGRYCEQSMKFERMELCVGNLLAAATWAECAEVWSMFAFDEAARA